MRELDSRYDGHFYGDGCPEHPALANGRPIYRDDPIIIPRDRPARPLIGRTSMVRDVLTELRVAEAKFPDQHLPSGTPEHAHRMGLEKARGQAKRTSDMYRKIVKEKAANGTLTWWDVLREEFYEVGVEDDPERLRAELVQVAAMAFRWAMDLELGPDRTINVPPDPPELDGRERKARQHDQALADVYGGVPAGPPPPLIRGHRYDADRKGVPCQVILDGLLPENVCGAPEAEHASSAWSVATPPDEMESRDRELARHLISEHASPGAATMSPAELIEHHEHEHDGPGTIRNHDRASRHWLQRKIDEVLAEAREAQ